MSQKEQMMELLAEYGIHSEAELYRALRELKGAKIDISPFVTPLHKDADSYERS